MRDDTVPPAEPGREGGAPLLRLPGVAEALLSAWRRTLRLWRPMAAWTAGVWVVVAVSLGPASSVWLGRRLLGEDAVRGNEELLTWLLTPSGLGYGVLIAAAAVGAAVIRFAGLFQIVTADLEGRAPELRSIALRLARQAPALLRVSLVVGGGLLALAGGAVAGPAGAHAALLREFDINYYLEHRPAEWWIALGLAATWLAGWAAGAAYLLGRSVLALPAYLDGHRPGRTALARAWRRTRSGTVRLLAILGGALAAWLLGRAALDAGFLQLAGAVLEEVGAASRSIRPLVLTAAALAAAALALDAVVGFLGFSFAATVLTKLYYEGTDLHATAPPVPGFEEWRARALARLRPWLAPRRLVPLGGLALLASFALSGWLLERVPEGRRAAVTAHRAGPAPAPENTLAALELAIRAGADYAELDVQRTRDGVVVVVHDADLMRTAGVPLRIGEVDFAALASVVQGPGSPFPPGERGVATLDRFLERARGRIRLLVELKYYGPDPGLAGRVVERIRAAGMEEEVVVMSLSLDAVRQVRRLAPEIRVGYASAVAVGDVSRLPVEMLAVARGRATRALIRAARRREMEVHVWTVNEVRPMVEAIERGADGVITDRPELAARVSRELAELPAPARLLLRFQTGVVGSERLPGNEGDAEG